MTTRSIHSSLSNVEERQDDEIYQYTLRVAYLKTISTAPLSSNSISLTSSRLTGSSTGTSNSLGPPVLKSSNSFRPAEGWTSALLFKDVSSGGGSSTSSGKGVKFPKELIKVLDEKLKRIAQGQDLEEYKQVLLRTTIGVFWNQFGTPEFKKKLLEERKIEELILRFVAIASKKLKERLGDGVNGRKSEAGVEFDGIGDWKEELNSQVGLFVKIVKECLKSKEIGKVPTELFTRLDVYYSEVMPSSNIRKSVQLLRTETATSQSTASSANDHNSISNVNGVGATNVSEMPLVLSVGKLFRRSIQDLQRDVIAMRRYCTEAVSTFSSLVRRY